MTFSSVIERCIMSTRAEYRAKLRAASEERKKRGFPEPNRPGKAAKVTMADYLAVCNERDAWRRRALDAEARGKNSGDVLGEGRFIAGKHQSGGTEPSF